VTMTIVTGVRHADRSLNDVALAPGSLSVAAKTAYKTGSTKFRPSAGPAPSVSRRFHRG